MLLVLPFCITPAGLFGYKPARTKWKQRPIPPRPISTRNRRSGVSGVPGSRCRRLPRRQPVASRCATDNALTGGTT